MLVVNCDRAEEQFKQHLGAMDPNWFAVPYECQGAAERLEDLAEAANIPRVAIMNPSQSIEQCQINDVKSIILRNQSSE